MPSQKIADRATVMAALALPTFMATQQLTFGIFFGVKKQHKSHLLTVYLIHIYILYLRSIRTYTKIPISNMRISYRANVILNSQKEPKETSQAAKSSLYFARLQSPIQGDSPHVYCLKLFDINCGWRCMHVIACGSILSRETRNKQSISWFWIRDINLIALHGIYQIHYDCQCLWHLVPNQASSCQ